MNRIRAYYSPRYTAGGAPLFARLGQAAALIGANPAVDMVAPQLCGRDQLQGLHDAEYLSCFLTGEEPLASSQGISWSPAIRDATLAMLGGQLEGAAHVMAHGGVAANLARGFHHAVPQRGTALCPLNGLALVAHAMPDKRIVVLDCDEHGGNGTEEFSAGLPNLYNISIFGTRFGCRGGPRSWALPSRRSDTTTHEYGEALAQAESHVAALRPDLLVYQAGVDCHIKDPKGRTGLTTRELFRRDLRVFRMAGQQQLPVLFVLAGGYQAPRGVARLNRNTMRAALIATASRGGESQYSVG